MPSCVTATTWPMTFVVQASRLLFPGQARRLHHKNCPIHVAAQLRHGVPRWNKPSPPRGRQCNCRLNWIFPPPPSALRALALLPALADVVRRFNIPREHLLAVIDGVEMDLTPQRYETFDELERYCERVASAVGLACIHIWGFRGPEAFEPARQAGVALQLTNILRDLKEDAAAGRIYLPLADLRRCGYSQEELLAGTANDAFLALMQLEIERAKQFYRGAAGLRDWLDPDGRRIFGLMTATYCQLLQQIENRPADVLRRRVWLTSLTRLRLFAQWMLFSRWMT